MDTPQTLYESTQYTHQYADSNPQEASGKKRHLIIKTHDLHVSLRATYLEVSDGVLSQVYGIKQLDKLYLHKDLHVSISDIYALSKHLEIFFIDARGTILARYHRMHTV